MYKVRLTAARRMSNCSMFDSDGIQRIVRARTDSNDKHVGKQLEQRFDPRLTDRKVTLG